MSHTIAVVLAGLTLCSGQAVEAEESRTVLAPAASQTRSGLGYALGSSDILVAEQRWGARVRSPCDDGAPDCCDPYRSQWINLRWSTCCDLDLRDDCGPIAQFPGFLDPPSAQRPSLRPVAIMSEGRSFT